ncbi:hypothetical protein D3C80_1686480 [compost metagenome]
MFVDQANHFVGERFPSEAGMRMCLSGSHGQYRIEKQHSLMCPAFQIAMRWTRKTRYRTFQLFIHVQQRRWGGNARTNRESQTMRLSWTVVRILTQYHDFDVIQLGVTKSVEHIFLRRIDCLA